VIGNRLENVLYDTSQSAGREMGLDVREPIDARHARDVIVRDNVLTHVGVPPSE
jgi:hypothetical protein